MLLKPMTHRGSILNQPLSCKHLWGSSHRSLTASGRDELYLRCVLDVQGRYNPLTHTWIEQPDTAAQAVKQKQADRIYGRVGIRTCNIPNSPNTGSGAAEVLSLDAPAVESSAAADTNFFLASGPNSSTGASIGGASGSGSSRGASSTGGSSSGSGRRCQSAPRTVRDHGDTW